MRREMTPAEAALWEKLRDRRLADAKFRRQQVIAGFIADFYCHEAALAVEVDEATHEAQHDAERDAVFAAKGITTLCFTNAEVQQNMESVLNRLRAFLKSEPSSNSNTEK